MNRNINQNQTAGAVYQISNDLTNNNNRVLVYRILSDGTLQYVTAVATDGDGTTSTQPDPFYSQGPVVVYGQNLFVVNPTSNSISVFDINPDDPTQISLLNTVSSGGDYPISIAVNSHYIAVLNGGSRSGFQVYTWSPNGNLIPIPNWRRRIALNPRQTTPPTGPPNSLSQIIFSPNGRNIIVLYKGLSDSQPGSVLIYPISSNGTLADIPAINVPATGYLPFSTIPIGNNGLLITNASSGINTLFYNSRTGQEQNRNQWFLPISGAVCWSAYSPKTGNYYVIGATSGNISEVHVDSSTLRPTLVQTYPLGANSEPADAQITTINGRDYLYVNAQGSGQVSILRLDGPGRATLLPPLQLSRRITNSMNNSIIAGLGTYHIY